MKTSIFLIFLMVLSGELFSQQKREVLFLGNSYTYVNDLPFLTAQIALSKGDTLLYDSNTPGGYTFQAHATNSQSIAKIFQQNWDAVVLQEQSQLPSFPPAQVQSQVYPWADSLVKQIRLNDSCTVPVFFMTWGRKNGDASNCPSWPPVCTYLGMQEKLRQSYLEMSQLFNAAVAPVGVVWKFVRAMYPAIELYDADESHPALAGSYLAACTFYSSLFHKSPIGAAFPSGIDSLTATQIQNSAHVIFFDSLWMWNIDTSKVTANFISSIASSVVSFTNTSFNANAFLWNFGDGNFSQDINPVHNYASSGNYNITLKAYGNCKSDSTAQQIYIHHVGVENLNNSDQVIIFPNPATREIFIRHSSLSFNKFLILDNKGSCVALGDYSRDYPIKLLNISPGLYTIILTGTHTIIKKNFIIQP